MSLPAMTALYVYWLLLMRTYIQNTFMPEITKCGLYNPSICKHVATSRCLWGFCWAAEVSDSVKAKLHKHWTHDDETCRRCDRNAYCIAHKAEKPKCK